jgi:Fe-S-cluster-containing dehydrogenase component/DMSO reductase anchor subunit
VLRRIFEDAVSVAGNIVLVEELLKKQRALTAVERFAQRHAANDVPAAGVYEALVPLSRPGPGQQYGFRVDLDACTGCKACVAACHSLNGLDDDEAWRTVGLLHGGTSGAPTQQTVTTACHHCLDPACMNGCPVRAYEKDPVTGIVRHLDDQCIGCQYCVLTCPYEVPQFNKSRGIVRKCDMCSDRLGAGEAPACAQACPNTAISIQIVDKARVLEEAQAGTFLPGAPSPGVTAPSTEYVSKRAFPRNLLPADFYQERTGHPHLPLVFMLVLTQLSVGAFLVAFVVEYLLRRLGGGPRADWMESARGFHAIVALSAGLMALGASVFHLGRPKYAFRAVIGLRTSWLSREIAAFGAFAGSAALYAAYVWRGPLLALLHAPPLPKVITGAALGSIVAASGLGGVACSVMLYVKTAREWWSSGRTAFRFFSTVALLGLATTVVTTLAFGGGGPAERATVVALAHVLAIATGTKLLWEAALFVHLRDKQLGSLRRTALLMKGPLRREAGARFGLAFAGGVLAPLIIGALVGGDGSVAAAVTVAALGSVALVAAELLERALFFRAAAPPRMPGGLH